MILLTPFIDGPIGGSQPNITLFVAFAIFGMALLIKAILPSNENRERKFLDWNSFIEVPFLERNHKDPRFLSNELHPEFLNHEMDKLLNEYFDKLKVKPISKYTAKFCLDWIRNFYIFREFRTLHPLIIQPTHFRFLEYKKDEVFEVFKKAEQRHSHEFIEIEKYMVENVSPYLERYTYTVFHSEVNTSYGKKIKEKDTVDEDEY